MRKQGIVLKYHGHIPLPAGNIVYQTAVHIEISPAELLQARNHPQGGGFAAAGRSQQNQALSFPDFHIQILYDYIFVISLYYMVKYYVFHLFLLI